MQRKSLAFLLLYRLKTSNDSQKLAPGSGKKKKGRFNLGLCYKNELHCLSGTPSPDTVVLSEPHQKATRESRGMNDMLLPVMELSCVYSHTLSVPFEMVLSKSALCTKVFNVRLVVK